MKLTAAFILACLSTTATKGYGAIETNDEVRVRCELKR